MADLHNQLCLNPKRRCLSTKSLRDGHGQETRGCPTIRLTSVELICVLQR